MAVLHLVSASCMSILVLGYQPVLMIIKSALMSDIKKIKPPQKNTKNFIHFVLTFLPSLSCKQGKCHLSDVRRAFWKVFGFIMLCFPCRNLHDTKESGIWHLQDKLLDCLWSSALIFISEMACYARITRTQWLQIKVMLLSLVQVSAADAMVLCDVLGGFSQSFSAGIIILLLSVFILFSTQ